jgi:dTDP-glucose 4,6-dehydratase
MKLVVVTGCLGFIGSYVTKACLRKGWQVYGIDKCTYAANEDLIEEFSQNKNFTFVKEDIKDLKYLPDCDYIINLAAETHVGNSIIDSTEFVDTNVMGVKNLLDLIRKKPKNISQRPILFHISTDEVYGDIVEGFHTEESNLNPSNPYSASKAASDMLILAWARTYDIDYLILRPTNNYGIGPYPEKLIPLIVKLLQRGKKVRLHDEGLPTRNWLHASDTAEAIIKVVESGKVNEIYNVEGDFEQQNIVTAKKVINCFYNYSVKVEHKSWYNLLDLAYKREGQDVRYALNDEKIKKLGWKAVKKFDEEICDIVEYYKNNFRW